MGDEELGVGARGVHSRFGQALLCQIKRVGGLHSPSARRRSSAPSASVNSSNSP